MSFAKIMVPTDFSSDAEAALETAMALAKVCGSKLYLVHTYILDIAPSYVGADISLMNVQEILDQVRKAAEATLDEIRRVVAEKGFDVESIVIMEHPSHGIVAEADRLSADLIVMGTRGLTGFKHVVLGSTAERVVRTAPCPVLTVKAAD